MTFTVGGQLPALPVGSLILVTGANSYIGSHLCDQLLQRGYRVRGTVRSIARTSWLTDLFAQRYGQDKFELVEVSSFAAAGVFESLCEGSAGVAHIASVDSEGMASGDPNQLVTPVVEASVASLKAAVASSTVKRFLFMASSASIYSPSRHSRVPKLITPQDVNLRATAAAWAPPPYSQDRMADIYAASKAQAVDAMFRFLREHDGPVDLEFSTVHPDTNWGEVLSPKATSTAAMLRTAWDARDAAKLAMFANMGYRWVVNVKDTARLCVSGLLDRDVRNEKILAYNEKYNGDMVRQIFLKVQQELGEEQRIGEAVEGDYLCIDEVDHSRSTVLLGRLGHNGWVGLEQSVRETLGVWKGE